MIQRLQGIVPPMITPLAARDELDHPGLERLVDRIVDGGVSGLFLLGTTGEAPSLSYRLRRELIERVCRQVDDRVPVLVGITDTAFEESVALARFAADAGATMLVLATPYYFPAGQTELKEYIRHLVPELPLPLMLYNMPALTKVWFEPETLRELSDLGGIAGLKDSSGDLDYFARLVALKEQRPDWSVFMGPEHLLPTAVGLGGDGGVNGGANLFPELFVDTWKATTGGDDEALAPLVARIEALQAIYEIGKYASRHIKATKSALSILGVCNDFMAEPFHRFKAPERVRVAAILDALGAP